MEIFIGLVVIVLPLAMFIGSVLGYVAWSRLRKLSARLEDSQTLRDLDESPATARRLQRLEDRIRNLEQARHVEIENVEAPLVQEPASAQAPPLVETPPPTQLSEPVSPLEAQQAEAPPVPAPPEDPPADQPPRKPREKILSIDWERWVGVRGAAAAGGIVLALAALLFFQYSIEHGLISATMRVVLGTIVGIGCLVGSEFLIRRDQTSAANALAGAGVVALYGATWAAHVLYSLIGAFPAAVLMVLITAVCVSLAVARQSQFIAVLGLLGGFSTPVLITSDPAGPAALFAYILLLDLGLLWLARARDWPLLAILSLVGTAVHQGLWIFSDMDAERAALGLVVLGVFGVAFLLVGGREGRSNALWRATRAGGIAIPFAFAMHFAGAAQLSDNPITLGALLVVLSAGACWLSWRGFAPAGVGAAAASLGVMSLWAITHRFTSVSAWQMTGVSIAIVATYTVFAWLSRNRSASSSLWLAAVVSNLGLMVLTVLCTGAASVHRPWPWLTVWVVAGAGLMLLATWPKKAWLQLPVGIVPSIGIFVSANAHGRSTEALSVEGLALLMIGTALVLQIVSVLVRNPSYRRWSGFSAAVSALTLMPTAAAMVAYHRTDGLLGLVTVGLLALLAALAATRLQSGPWYLATVIASALWHTVVFEEAFTAVPPASGLGGPLVLLAIMVGFFTAWPALAAPSAFLRSRAAWWGAALAGPLYFIVLREAYVAHFGRAAIGVLPIALALITLITILLAKPKLQDDDGTLHSAQVWFLAVTLCLVAVAIPLQLDKEWITIGWALNGLAILALWVRLDHPGLKYFGIALLAAATLRLIANPEVLGYHLRGSTPVLNWISYTYLVPALAMVLSMRCLAPREVQRLLPWESRLNPQEKPLATAFCGLAAIATVFAWINLAIADVFAAGSSLELTFKRLPARDATTSIAWAIYAIVLLIIGVRKHSKSLRWLSLGLLVATLAKVFLHDLGELEDLYRVASLVGLAISLIVVSLIYQKFVFSADSGAES